MTDNVALVKRLYDDFSRGDVLAVLAHFDDEIEWYEAEGNPYWNGAPAVGGQQVLEQVFARIPQDYEAFTIHVRRIVGLGDCVLMEGRYTAVGRATGLPMDAQVAHLWDFADGKAVRWQQYIDTAQMRRVFGTTAGDAALDPEIRERHAM